MKKQFLKWLMKSYKSYKQKKSDTSLEHALVTVRKTLKKVRFGFFISLGENGWVSARYVQPIVEWGEGELTIHVGTLADSRKVSEVRKSDKITLAFGSESSGANLIVYGRANVSGDSSLCRKYWHPSWEMFFPGGPESDDMVIVSIVPEQMEILDFRHNIIPEPFGLKSLALQREVGGWQLRPQ